jgi:MFS family permease
MNGVSRFQDGRRLGRAASFTLLVFANVLMMAAASAPSPIYPLYLQRWGFSVTTLTVVFGVYVVGLLGALLTVGSLSDYLGRRPVLVASLLVAAASTAIFWAADGVISLVLARTVQGVATGMATGALAAGLVEFSPGKRPHRPEFLAAVPAIVAGWSVTGLFLALTPSLVSDVLHVCRGRKCSRPST